MVGIEKSPSRPKITAENRSPSRCFSISEILNGVSNFSASKSVAFLFIPDSPPSSFVRLLMPVPGIQKCSVLSNIDRKPFTAYGRAYTRLRKIELYARCYLNAFSKTHYMLLFVLFSYDYTWC
jgi:hypothetical protein